MAGEGSNHDAVFFDNIARIAGEACLRESLLMRFASWVNPLPISQGRAEIAVDDLEGLLALIDAGHPSACALGLAYLATRLDTDIPGLDAARLGRANARFSSILASAKAASRLVVSAAACREVDYLDMLSGLDVAGRPFQSVLLRGLFMRIAAGDGIAPDIAALCIEDLSGTGADGHVAVAMRLVRDTDLALVSTRYIGRVIYSICSLLAVRRRSSRLLGRKLVEVCSARGGEMDYATGLLLRSLSLRRDEKACLVALRVLDELAGLAAAAGDPRDQASACFKGAALCQLLADITGERRYLVEAVDRAGASWAAGRHLEEPRRHALETKCLAMELTCRNRLGEKAHACDLALAIVNRKDSELKLHSCFFLKQYGSSRQKARAIQVLSAFVHGSPDTAGMVDYVSAEIVLQALNGVVDLRGGLNIVASIMEPAAFAEKILAFCEYLASDTLPAAAISARVRRVGSSQPGDYCRRLVAALGGR